MAATFDLGVNGHILVFASEKKGVPKAEINPLRGLPRLRTTKSANDALALAEKKVEKQSSGHSCDI